MSVIARAAVTLSVERDITAAYRYYMTQASTLSPPAKPTANPPGGSWQLTEPAYTAGSTTSLYTTDLTVFSDGTWAYSDVSLSSSYEAAKAAYNKAHAAEETAGEARSTADAAQTTADDAKTVTDRLARYIEIDDDEGMRQYVPGSTYSTLVDETGYHIEQNREKIASFYKRALATEQIRVGPLKTPGAIVMRRSGDGGLIFVPEDMT